MKVSNYFKIDTSLFTVSSSVGKLSLFPLMVPILLEYVLNFLQGTVNTAILGNYSETAVAAVGASNSVISVVLLLSNIVALGASVTITKSFGEEKLLKAQKISCTAVTLTVFTAIIAIPLLLITGDYIFKLLNLTGEVYTLGLLYFRVRVIFLIFNMINSALFAILKCYGYPKYTFITGLLINLLNLVFNIYVIYFPEYAPVSGVFGVALGCGISTTIGTLTAIIIVVKLKIKFKKPRILSEFLKYSKNILKIGIPSGLSSATFMISQLIITSFIALLGDYALTAKVYFTNILSYVYLFSVSAGNANALIVGRYFGAGDFERPELINRQLVKLTRLVNLSVSLFVLILRRPLLSLFTDDPLIISISLGVFAIDIITEQARATSQVYEYSLRAAGDVVFSVIVVIISCIVCSVLLAYIFTIKLGFGLIGCWMGLALDETVRAVATYLRWKYGKWKIKEN